MDREDSELVINMSIVVIVCFLIIVGCFLTLQKVVEVRSELCDKEHKISIEVIEIINEFEVMVRCEEGKIRKCDVCLSKKRNDQIGDWEIKGRIDNEHVLVSCLECGEDIEAVIKDMQREEVTCKKCEELEI